MTIRCMLMHPRACLPTRSTDGSVGFDLTACARVVIGAGRASKVETGIAIELPEPVNMHVEGIGGAGLVRVAIHAQVHGRSGLAFRHDIVTHTGIIDTDYRGTLGVKLWNLGDIGYIVEVGDRVAQLVFSQVLLPDLGVTSLLSKTERGDKGYGSSGR